MCIWGLLGDTGCAKGKYQCYFAHINRRILMSNNISVTKEDQILSWGPHTDRFGEVGYEAKGKLATYTIIVYGDDYFELTCSFADGSSTTPWSYSNLNEAQQAGGFAEECLGLALGTTKRN
jgi:hypothetical protein